MPEKMRKAQEDAGIEQQAPSTLFPLPVTLDPRLSTPSLYLSTALDPISTTFFYLLALFPLPSNPLSAFHPHPRSHPPFTLTVYH